MRSDWEQLLKLLAAGDKSRAQVISALQRRDLTVEQIEPLIERATQLGYLNDPRFASRQALLELDRGWAGEALELRLLAKGLDAAVSRSAIRDAMAQTGWNPVEAARSLVRHKRLQGARAARFLLSRGFEEEVVQGVVDLADEV